MQPVRLKKMLEDVAAGRLEIAQALDQLKHWPFEDIDFAKPDHHRHLRQGFPEVIFGERKTPTQIAKIAAALAKQSDLILVTRVNPAGVSALRRARLAVKHEAAAGCAVISRKPWPKTRGRVAVVTAGTTDIPVAEEAALTARLLGADVDKIYDVGVAGIHRLLAHRERLAQARCIVVAAGMEGALASVVAGLVACPVVAVPTSVGYGAAFGGVAALLAMLNSCASNVAVVNIDNGFGAGYFAGMVNRENPS